MARSQGVPTTMMSLADPNGQTFAPYAPTANTYFHTEMNVGSPASDFATMVDQHYSGVSREGIVDQWLEKAQLTRDGSEEGEWWEGMMKSSPPKTMHHQILVNESIVPGVQWEEMWIEKLVKS